MSVIFPKWTNVLPTALAIGGFLGLTSVVGGFWYYATPKFFKVGYMPTQPGGGDVRLVRLLHVAVAVPAVHA